VAINLQKQNKIKYSRQIKISTYKLTKQYCNNLA
jgi:Tfp pilus assembly PilM family ATPase